MTPQEALEIVEFRRKYCANIYGSGYVTELPIYEACEKALRFQIENEEKQLTQDELYQVSKAFQHAYIFGIDEIAREDETIASLFRKIGLIDDDGDNV